MTTGIQPRESRTQDFAKAVADLLVIESKAPEKAAEAAKMFARALDQHLQDVFIRDIDLAFARIFGKSLDPRLLKELSAHIGRTVATSPARASEKQEWTTTRKPGGGVEKAIEDGARFKQETLRGEDMLSSKEGAERAGITRQALDNRRKNNQALGLSLASRSYRYPAWQFDDAVAAVLSEILKALGDKNTWSKYLFFVEPEPLLKGMSPLQALKDGKADDVLRVARLLSVED